MNDEFNTYDSLYFPQNASGIKTRASLLAQMNADEISEAAWRDFFIKYRPYIVGIGKEQGLTHPEIKDLLGIVYDEIRKKGIKAYQSDRGAFHSWYYKLILRRALDILRRRKRQEETITDDFSNFASESDVEEEDRTRKLWMEMLMFSILLELKKTLNPIHYQIFYLGCLQGRNSMSVAEVTNTKPNTVNVIIKRIREKFFEAFHNLSKASPLENFTEAELIAKVQAMHLQYRAIEKEYSDLLD